MRRLLLVFASTLAVGPAHAHPSEQDALRDLDARLAATPEASDLQLERAEHLLELRRGAEALAAVAASGAATARAEVLRARALVLMGAGDAARAALDRAVRRAPKDLQARWHRAALAEGAGERARAVADLEVIIRDPRVAPDAYLWLARLLADDPPRAQEVLQMGARRTGAAALSVALVEQALAGGELAVAQAEVERLVAASRVPVQALLLRARVAEARGRAAAARADRAAALAAAEVAVAARGSAATLAWRAHAKAALGDRVGARTDAEAALRRAPGLALAKSALEVAR
jgi:hypothetical protein